MLAFHHDPALKQQILDRLAAHRAAGEIAQGPADEWTRDPIWGNGKGTAVGCTINGTELALYESQLGIPARLGNVEDAIFLWLPDEDKLAWPGRFIEPIAAGAELSGVWAAFAAWLLDDRYQGTVRFVAGYPDCEACVREVAALLRVSGTHEAFMRAVEKAWGAAARAGEAAWISEPNAGNASSAARVAAWNAREVPDPKWLARAAAFAVHDAAQVAGQGFCGVLADCLIDLLRTAPVPETG